MARELSDVLHHLLPEPEPDPPAAAGAPAAAPASRVAIPLVERDVLGAALVWNLAVELARRDTGVTVFAPDGEGRDALWPPHTPGVKIEGLGDETSGDTGRGGFALLCFPPERPPEHADTLLPFSRCEMGSGI